MEYNHQQFTPAKLEDSGKEVCCRAHLLLHDGRCGFLRCHTHCRTHDSLRSPRPEGMLVAQAASPEAVLVPAGGKWGRSSRDAMQRRALLVA